MRSWDVPFRNCYTFQFQCRRGRSASTANANGTDLRSWEGVHSFWQSTHMLSSCMWPCQKYQDGRSSCRPPAATMQPCSFFSSPCSDDCKALLREPRLLPSFHVLSKEICWSGFAAATATVQSIRSMREAVDSGHNHLLEMTSNPLDWLVLTIQQLQLTDLLALKNVALGRPSLSVSVRLRCKPTSCSG